MEYKRETCVKKAIEFCEKIDNYNKEKEYYYISDLIIYGSLVNSQKEKIHDIDFLIKRGNRNQSKLVYLGDRPSIEETENYFKIIKGGKLLNISVIKTLDDAEETLKDLHIILIKNGSLVPNYKKKLEKLLNPQNIKLKFQNSFDEIDIREWRSREFSKINKSSFRKKKSEENEYLYALRKAIYEKLPEKYFNPNEFITEIVMNSICSIEMINFENNLANKIIAFPENYIFEDFLYEKDVYNLIKKRVSPGFRQSREQILYFTIKGNIEELINCIIHINIFDLGLEYGDYDFDTWVVLNNYNKELSSYVREEMWLEYKDYLGQDANYCKNLLSLKVFDIAKNDGINCMEVFNPEILADLMISTINNHLGNEKYIIFLLDGKVEEKIRRINDYGTLWYTDPFGFKEKMMQGIECSDNLPFKKIRLRTRKEI